MSKKELQKIDNGEVEKKEKSFLSNAFSVAAQASFGYLIFPKSKVGFVAVFFGIGVMPYVSDVFQTAEEYITDLGYDYSLVSDLVDKETRIRFNDKKGEIYDYLKTPTLYGAYSYLDNKLGESEYKASAVYGAKNAACMIKINQSKNASMVDYINWHTKVPKEYIEYQGLNVDEYKLYILLHEMAHCHLENFFPNQIVVGMFDEGDADKKAANAFYKLTGNGEIFNFVKNLRALNNGRGIHDVSLYLSSGERISMEEERRQSLVIKKASEIAFAKAELEAVIYDDTPEFKAIADYFKNKLADVNYIEGENFYVLERMFNYVKAAEYFSPTLMGVNVEYTYSENSQFRMNNPMSTGF